jgi:hypothetical protein
MKEVIKHITKITIHLSKNKTDEIEKNYSREYSNSIEDYLKEEVKKYKDIEVVIINKPKERK